MINVRLGLYYWFRTIGWILLALGAGAGLYGLIETIRLYGQEYLAITYGRGVPSLGVFILSFAYFLIFLKKGFSVRALLMYLGSYLLLGFLLDMLVRMIYKGFPPSPPDEAKMAIIISCLTIAVSFIFAISGIIWAARRGHNWHNKWFAPKKTQLN